MTIFEQEIKDGVGEAVGKQLSVAYCSGPLSPSTFEYKELIQPKIATASVKETIDLYPVQDIMVSSGFNKNDDYFDQVEMWNARETPVDKWLNIEHNEKDIVGHITMSVAVDDKYKPLVDVSPVDLPEKYHLLTNSVIYKSWADQETMTRIMTCIEEIKAGKRYVSMEALFDSFDYALLDSAIGSVKIIPRKQETAFLTKHLKCYGGTGQYNGRRIGRVLRNIIFSGKAVVLKPANPDSVFINEIQDFKQPSNSLGYVIMTDTTKGSENMNEIELLKKQIDDLKAALKAKDEDNAKLQASVKEFNVKEYQVKIDALTAEAKAKDVKVAELICEKDKAVEVAKALEKSFSELKQNYDKVAADLSTIQTERTKAARKDKLVKVGKTIEQADVLVVTLSKLDETEFDKFVEVAKASVPATPVNPGQTETPVVPAFGGDAGSDDAELIKGVSAYLAEMGYKTQKGKK